MKKNATKQEITSKGPRIAPLRSFIFILLAAGLVALDQLTKTRVLANETLMAGGEIALIPNLFSLRYTFNTGAAWSILADQTWGIYLLSGISAVASLVFLFLLIKRSGWPVFLPLSLTMVLAGAAGNLIDRFYLGGVVDFFDFFYGDWHFPTFNVADSLITVGVIFLIIYLIFFEEKHRERFLKEQKNKIRPL